MCTNFFCLTEDANFCISNGLLTPMKVLLFSPPLLAGTMIGGLFSAMFPEWLIVVCLVVILGYTSKQTIQKGISKWSQSDLMNSSVVEKSIVVRFDFALFLLISNVVVLDMNP